MPGVLKKLKAGRRARTVVVGWLAGSEAAREFGLGGRRGSARDEGWVGLVRRDGTSLSVIWSVLGSPQRFMTLTSWWRVQVCANLLSRTVGGCSHVALPGSVLLGGAPPTGRRLFVETWVSRGSPLSLWAADRRRPSLDLAFHPPARTRDVHSSSD